MWGDTLKVQGLPIRASKTSHANVARVGPLDCVSMSLSMYGLRAHPRTAVPNVELPCEGPLGSWGDEEASFHPAQTPASPTQAFNSIHGGQPSGSQNSGNHFTPNACYVVWCRVHHSLMPTVVHPLEMIVDFVRMQGRLHSQHMPASFCRFSNALLAPVQPPASQSAAKGSFQLVSLQIQQ